MKSSGGILEVAYNIEESTTRNISCSLSTLLALETNLGMEIVPGLIGRIDHS
jgi:hypothetical protein